MTPAEIPEELCKSLTAQVKNLADVILLEVPGEPSESGWGG